MLSFGGENAAFLHNAVTITQLFDFEGVFSIIAHEQAYFFPAQSGFNQISSAQL